MNNLFERLYREMGFLATESLVTKPQAQEETKSTAYNLSKT